MLKHLDLFSGIGGFALAAKKAGNIDTVAFCEKDKFCQKVLAKNFPNIEVFEDIKELEYDGQVDIITSGDPCQRDSLQNSKRDGKSMWPWSFRQIQRHKPLYVLRENVLGNVSTGTLERVESDLRSQGYQVRSYVIPAISVGAAHHRLRTWTLAYTPSDRRVSVKNATKPITQMWGNTLHIGKAGIHWVANQSPILRGTDDVSDRIYRIKSLGNAIVWPIAYVFLKSIVEFER